MEVKMQKKQSYFWISFILFSLISQNVGAQLFDIDSYASFKPEEGLLHSSDDNAASPIYRIHANELTPSLLKQKLSGLAVNHSYSHTLGAKRLKHFDFRQLTYLEITVEDLEALNTIVHKSAETTHLFLNVIAPITRDTLIPWEDFSELHRIDEIGLSVPYISVLVELLKAWKPQMLRGDAKRRPHLVIYLTLPPFPLLEDDSDTEENNPEGELFALIDDYGELLKIIFFSEFNINPNTRFIPVRHFPLIKQLGRLEGEGRIIFDLFVNHETSSLKDASDALSFIDTKFMGASRKAQLIEKLAGLPITYRHQAAKAFQKGLAEAKTYAAFTSLSHDILWMLRHFEPEEFVQAALTLVKTFNKCSDLLQIKFFDNEIDRLKPELRLKATVSAAESMTNGLKIVDAFEAFAKEEL